MEKTDKVILVSKDNKEFIVSREVATVSPTLKAILEGPFKEKEGRVNLPEFDSRVLEKVIEYLQYNLQYKDADMPDEDVPEFDIPTEMSLELLLAADYLRI